MVDQPPLLDHDDSGVPPDRLVRMHLRYGRTPSQTCGSCWNFVLNGVCLSSPEGAQWDGSWEACGLWRKR